VHLRQGALIAQVPAGSPFTVQTRHGRTQVPAAQGARFMVRLQEERTQVAALAHDVVLHTRLDTQSPLRAGASAWMDGAAISGALARAEAAAAWQSGMLAVDDWPLDSVVEALRPYRPGLLRVAPAAARLRVLGTFALDDTDRALQALTSSLPIRVTRYRGGWLTLIEAA
jgi:transmembrane sensor